MKILHYTLGLPPYRTGGLTKYTVDLMENQIIQGQEISLLFPGQYSITKKYTQIKQGLSFKEIEVFEIINPLPVSLLNGVSKPDAFTKNVFPNNIYKQFLINLNPDIIHIHTLMGLHKEFFQAAKELGIKMIFTTHDYFGICPTGNLIDYDGEICMDNEEGRKCVTCNQQGYSMPLIYLMQSRGYRTFKNSKLVKKMRKVKKNSLKINKEIKRLNTEVIDLQVANKYKDLGKYYADLFSYIDYFHFNSNTAKEVYESCIDTVGEVISITNNSIQDNRVIKHYNNANQLKISFLGPLDQYKGFPLLLNALEKLSEKNLGDDWCLNVYGNASVTTVPAIIKKKVSFYGPYDHKELESIFTNTDMLVVPSVWKETFGFIALEALSFGVPVFVSEYVGFKDVIHHGETGYIFKAESAELAEALKLVLEDREKLTHINKQIVEEEFNFLMKYHTEKIQKLYEKAIGAY